MYCINDPYKTLKTTTTSSLNIIINRCTNHISQNITCSSDSEIDEWLENKEFNMGFLHDRIAINSFEERPVYRDNAWFPVIKLDKKDTFVSGDFYLRWNTFFRTDSYFGLKEDPFYLVDYISGIHEYLYTTDSYEIA